MHVCRFNFFRKFFRKFFRCIKLFLKQLSLAFAHIFRTIMSLLGFDFKFVIPEIFADPVFRYICYVIVSIICFILIVRMQRKYPDKVRDGLEYVSWEKSSKGRKIKLSVLYTVIILSYCPVISQSMHIFSGVGKFRYLVRTRQYGWFWFIAIVACIVIGIGLPWMCFRLVQLIKSNRVLLNTDGKTSFASHEECDEALVVNENRSRFLYKSYKQEGTFF